MTSLTKDVEKASETMARSTEIHTDIGYLAGKLQEIAQAAESKSGRYAMHHIMEEIADWALERKDDWSDPNYKTSVDLLLN